MADFGISGIEQLSYITSEQFSPEPRTKLSVLYTEILSKYQHRKKSHHSFFHVSISSFKIVTLNTLIPQMKQHANGTL
jgi:hypothetical protein